MLRLNLFTIGGLSLTLCCIALILINIFLGRKKIHFIWSLFNLSVAIWGFGAFMVGNTLQPKQAWFWWKINHIGVIWIPVFVLHTVYLLTSKVNKRILGFAYLEAFSFQVIELLPSKIFFQDLRFVFSFYYATPGAVYHFFFLIWIFLVLYAHWCVYKELAIAKGMRRLPLLYFLIGSTLGFSGGFTNFLIGYRIDIPPFGNFTIPIYCIIVTYAILRYRLMDIRIFVSKAVAFLVSYPFFLGVCFFFTYRLYPLLYAYLGLHWWLVPFGLVAFFSTLAPLAYAQLKRGMEEMLLAEQKRYQRLLLQAAEGMVREHNLLRLARLIVYILKRAVRISFCAIFLLDEGNKAFRLFAIRNRQKLPSYAVIPFEHPLIEFIQNKKAPLFYEELPSLTRKTLNLALMPQLIIPAFTESNLLGFVFLGEKLNNTPYTQDDLNIFTILSHQAALAIENCIFLEEFKKGQERIFNAEKLASIGGMAEGIAHQMRNRLNHFSLAAGEQKMEIQDFIAKNPKLIEEAPELKRSLDYLYETADSIVNNVKRTATTINGILNFARVEEKETFFGEFSLSEIIELSLEVLRVKHGLNEFPLVLDLPENDTIWGIKGQLLECIFNLLDNSYEAIEDKLKYRLSEEEKKNFQPQIKLRLSFEPDGYLIEISDNGCGIKEEDKPKIFSPFFTTKSSYISGMGIGMYVVKRIIEENHQGKITFASTYLEGTTFYLQLPYKK